MTDNGIKISNPAEKRMYMDIHKIAASLEKIEQHLSTIAKSYEPITFDIGETGMTLSAEFNREDDGK